jgi:tetratricopeptide (TPR) repeat protein
MLLGYALSITMIFVFARYRHPMTTIVLLFSATGISYIAVAVRQKRYVALIISGLIMAIVIPITNQEIFSKNDMIATTYYNVASTLDREGSLPEAIGFYRRSLQHNPEHVMAMNNLAIALFKSGEIEASQALLEGALKIDAGLPEVHNNIAIVAAAQRQYPIAGKHFHKVIELNPEYNPSVYYNLACIYALSHDIETAMDYLEKALSKGYHNWRAIQTDPDLANIRFSDRYQELLERHAKQP